MASEVAPVAEKIAASSDAGLKHLKVLCVDNEPDILVGMETLLERWGCDVRTALDLVGSLKHLDQGWEPDVILSDYRLDNGRTGLEVLQQFRLRVGDSFKGVIISADRTESMLEGIKSNGFALLLNLLSHLSCVRYSINPSDQ
ncbi:sensor histidine kinase [Vibrio maritimus]|uniref:Sensor histidine kinase n=1 Tax=Vibrio maritimus TaxID=990268 RepID=A0A090SV78_9VIBR|nr:sensor histidine kinase [Vibrio maritimus]